jgi:hypothetical protein
VLEPRDVEFDLVIDKLKIYKLPNTDLIPAEMIKAGGIANRYDIHKLIISIWNKEELPEEWKDSITLPIYKKDDLQLLLIIEVFRDHQCGFRRNRSTTDHIICISQIREKKRNTTKQCIIPF